jgi:hypothetical protein
LLAAQVVPPFPEGTVKVLGQRLSVGRTVKNSPYQATAITEVKQTLADGNEILRKSVAKMSRDSRGRVRLEQTEPEIGRMILVQDPEARSGFSFSPGTGRLQTYGTKKTGGANFPAMEGVSIGKTVVDGIAAEGKRQVTLIPAGQIGNAKAIEIVDESWYAPELQVIVKSLHSDPRSGVVSYRLTGIERKEPEAKLFEIPEGARPRQD